MISFSVIDEFASVCICDSSVFSFVFSFLWLEWVNDETYLNVESGRLLEEGTFECRNVGKRCLTELNIVNNHHSKNKESGVGKAKAKKRKL